MDLIEFHPEVAFRDCEVCQKYVFDGLGNIETNSATGEPVKRPKGVFPPCRYDPKACPKGSPEQCRGINDQNLQAYQHYRECRAVGQFPDDPIVRENAAIIRGIEDQVQKLDQQKLLLDVLKIAASGG